MIKGNGDPACTTAVDASVRSRNDTSPDLDVKDEGKGTANVAESVADTEKQFIDLSDSKPPDGGLRAWSIVLGSFFANFATFGYVNSWGYWQFLLCQGFFIGISCGVVFGPSMGMISHWFKRRRGIALGISAVGSSVGGTIFPIAASRLIDEVGFKWCMRILGFMQLFALIIVNLCMARRGPPSKVPRKVFDLKAFKNLAYTFWCLSGMVVFLGLYTVLTYIDVSAVFAGLSPNFTFYLISIANVASCFGRILGGLVADRKGPINALLFPTLMAGGLTYAWPFARTTGEFIVIAIFYGVASGVYVTLFNAPFMEMGNPHDVGTRIGMGATIIAVGAISGPPISGAINAATGGYKAVGYYAGSMIMFSYYLLGQWKGRA
ncbi:hypothetical protein EIP91_004183 [Steccherinum ochraceum]|uniref:Major facilitator superfamily (MFS) profile domain-containing protein n=1 Tax=Steccherinum ochraceum TaxID=92696 RepID=A0A4R0RST4_9APHY|nr:hypothetical protein EIP91_004183 [Steccherinum ochraceum]